MDNIYGFCLRGSGEFVEVGRTERGAKASASRHGCVIVGYRSPINNMFIQTAVKNNGKWERFRHI